MVFLGFPSRAIGHAGLDPSVEFAAKPAAKSPEFRPARTSYGIHVLDEDGAFDVGSLPSTDDDAPSAVETFHGLKLDQTVLLPGQSASKQSEPTAQEERGAGATAKQHGQRRPPCSRFNLNHKHTPR